MATVSQKIADEIIAKDGKYDDDPQVMLIIEYNNVFNGGKSYGVIYVHELPGRYQPSEFIKNPTVYWEWSPSEYVHGLSTSWLAPPTTGKLGCDLCKNEAHYDARTIQGPWGLLCLDHFISHGVGLGVGRGQRLIPSNTSNTNTNTNT